MYPTIEIHLRLDQVGAVHQPGSGAFGYVFRPLHWDTNLLPSRRNLGGVGALVGYRRCTCRERAVGSVHLMNTPPWCVGRPWRWT